LLSNKANNINHLRTSQVFDKVIVLYEGRQIYFGPSTQAREFFTSRGWHCPPRQTTADFLTSLTNPSERIAQEGWEGRVPRTPDEFARQWRESDERKHLLAEIEQYESEYPIGGEWLDKFKHSRNAQQSNHMCVFL
jgi:ATP-binding cassette, subfamily G (WHITE), member 2, PDR